jgi:hypothetical protein
MVSPADTPRADLMVRGVKKIGCLLRSAKCNGETPICFTPRTIKSVRIYGFDQPIEQDVVRDRSRPVAVRPCHRHGGALCIGLARLLAVGQRKRLGEGLGPYHGSTVLPVTVGVWVLGPLAAARRVFGVRIPALPLCTLAQDDVCAAVAGGERSWGRARRARSRVVRAADLAAAGTAIPPARGISTPSTRKEGWSRFSSRVVWEENLDPRLVELVHHRTHSWEAARHGVDEVELRTRVPVHAGY